MDEDRTRWMTELLATSIQVSGLAEDELEERLGWAPGSIGRLLDGESDLEPVQVMEILTELNSGIQLSRKGELAEMEDGRTQVVSDLLDRFRKLGYDEVGAVDPLPERLDAADAAELERHVETALREAFGYRFDEE